MFKAGDWVRVRLESGDELPVHVRAVNGRTLVVWPPVEDREELDVSETLGRAPASWTGGTEAEASAGGEGQGVYH